MEGREKNVVIENERIIVMNIIIRDPSSALRIYEWCYAGLLKGFLTEVYRDLVKLLSPGGGEES